MKPAYCCCVVCEQELQLQIIELWLRFALWLGHCNPLITSFFTHYVIDSLHCPIGWLTLSQALADGLMFNSRVLWHTEEFMFGSVTARCPRPLPAKQAPFFLQSVWSVCPYMLCKHDALHYGQNICLKVRTGFFFKCHYTSLSCVAVFFLERRGFPNRAH